MPEMPSKTEVTRLDEKGRCCGRKPMVYKHGGLTPMGSPHKFCPRCGNDYDIDTGERIYGNRKRQS